MQSQTNRTRKLPPFFYILLAVFVLGMPLISNAAIDSLFYNEYHNAETGDVYPFPKNLTSGFIEQLDQKAKNGDAEALLDMGMLKLHGIAISTDHQGALDYFTRAIALGNTDAMVMSGIMRINGLGVSAKNPAEGIHLFEKAAEKGNGRGMFELASAYMHGTGVKKDPARAVDYMNQSIATGYPAARIIMGIWTIQGKDIPKDVEKGVAMVKEAADTGETGAEITMGFIYKRGVLGYPDYENAKRWFQKAADKGSRRAAKALARISNEELMGGKMSQ